MTPPNPSKGALLRRLFESKPIVRIMGAHNALGAKLIEQSGFEGIWASGLEISTAHGVPDANILTMTENLAEAQKMNDAVFLPVVCDCDTGYGNASNVIHMVKKYEAAGLAAVVIEDKHFPKVNSFIPGRQELASIDEFAGKIEAAKSARQHADLMVFARIEALIAGWGLDEALKRAYAYEEAGADGIVIHSKSKTPDEVFAFSEKWKGKAPLVVIPTMFPQVTAGELQKHGFKMVIYANQGIRASIKAMTETFHIIRDTGSTAAVENKIASMEEVFQLQGMNLMKEDEKKFLKKGNVQAIIAAAGDHKSQTDLKPLIKDKPLCMLPIAGKALLDRQAELLRSAHVQDICVVGGYLFEKIKAEGVQAIRNPDFEKHQNAHSILSAEPCFKSKNLVLYGDILFDRLIVENLLASPHDLTLVIDRSYKSLPKRDKKLELVAIEHGREPENGRRLDLWGFKPIKKIGTRLNLGEADYEFIGMALVKDRAVEAMKSLWKKAKTETEFQTKPFYGAANIDQAHFTDLLQYMIDQGHPVFGMEIDHGWSEIHSLDDYERVNQYFQKLASTYS